VITKDKIKAYPIKCLSQKCDLDTLMNEKADPRELFTGSYIPYRPKPKLESLPTSPTLSIS